MKVLQIVKAPDKEKERSERGRSLEDFLESYNQNLPDSFPRASQKSLEVFRKTHASLFKNNKTPWCLETHRKKVMDWLPQYEKSLVE